MNTITFTTDVLAVVQSWEVRVTSDIKSGVSGVSVNCVRGSGENPDASKVFVGSLDLDHYWTIP